MISNENSNIKDSSEQSEVRIYSKKTIWAFSAFFAPVFGGVLLRQNLVSSGKKKEANIVLIISIIFTVGTYMIMNFVVKKAGSLSFVINAGFGTVLSEYFFKKYFPADHYPYKKIWRALIISILITTPFVLAMIYFPSE